MVRHRVLEHGFERRVKPKSFACLWPGCDYRTTNNHILSLHQNTHTGARPYQCQWPDCGKAFPIPKSLKDHMNIHNNLKPHACHWPGYKQHFRLLSLRLDQLSDKQTEQTIGSQKPQQKRVYKKRKTSEIVVKREDNDFGGEVVTNNEDSDQTKANQNTKVVKQRTSHFNDNNINPKATEEDKSWKPSTTTKSGYKTGRRRRLKHTYRLLNAKPYRCDRCDYRCKTASALRVHQSSHDNPITAAKRQLRADFERRCRIAGTGQYRCAEIGCGREFKDYDAIRSHIKGVHETVPTHACDQPSCGKVFKTKNGLSQHIKNVHNRERPFRCPHDGCDGRFYSQSHLDAHLVVHQTARPFLCDHEGCGKSFKSHIHLKFHKVRHSGQRTFRCTVDGCDARFFTHKQMAKHRVLEHGFERRVIPKSFACMWPGCDYRTANNYSLSLHQNTHTGARPYPCEWPDCGKAFPTPKGLKDHMNIHNNHKPYACHWPGCQYRCANSGNIVKHYKQVHQK
ncbi:unnamed protein product [Medioppia subpectinata]|uniref:C2H2-type domain-containing protein n=1 Tax=Medioppia subpectinata TaxID=1979941 RepID=A0A7R9KN50_9ACAR|nr:unnamed protein product [Medioppia subpectinata]CAG2106630.1 unnamed protein product [Medioppia subpectinata]